MRATRLVAVACLPIAAVGIALARGKKAAEPEPVVEAPPVSVAPPPPDPAPKLFPSGLPITLTELPAGLASLSAQACNACHWAAHDTWESSAHAHAWSDDTFQEALASAGGSTMCVSCHLPVTAQQDELAAGYIDGDLTRPRLQPNPSFDLTLRGEGVTCVACHLRGDTILGTRAAPDAPHKVTASEELSDPAMCATCHQLSWPEGDRPYYDTYGEWQASPYAKANVTCQDCHMAPMAGTTVPGSDGTLPSHALHADPRRALSALVQLPNARIVRGQPVEIGLTLQNTGAGHAVPTGNPNKIYTIEVVLLDAAGKPLAPAYSAVLARTVEAEPPYRTTADTRLGPAAQRSYKAAFTPTAKGAAGRGAIEVRLVRGEETIVLQRVMVDVS